MSSVSSSSSAPPSSCSRSSVACVVCPTVVDLVVVVVKGVVNRIGCLSLQTHRVAFHGIPCQAILCRGEPSRVVREIVAEETVHKKKVMVTQEDVERSEAKSGSIACMTCRNVSACSLVVILVLVLSGCCLFCAVDALQVVASTSAPLNWPLCCSVGRRVDGMFLLRLVNVGCVLAPVDSAAFARLPLSFLVEW